MLSVSYLLLGALLSSAWAQVSILTDPSQLTTDIYDFVIVGGGTAGLAVANRLTEDSNINVLVIEAGGNNQGVVDIEVPFLGSALTGTPYDWNFTTTPQTGLDNRVVPFARGHVLGGSSSINILAYNRGSNDVYNHWANIVDDQSWAWENVEQYYLQSSSLVASADNHNYAGYFIPSAHGTGPVEVSLPGFPTELDPLVINTAKQVGGRFSFQEDLNAGNSTGFSYLQSTIGQASRSSSATAYLDPLLTTRSNLVVVINTQAIKLVQNGTIGGKPSFNGVEISTGSGATVYTVTARNEVILSAGVVGTPRLLLLSGIGPTAELSSLGIPTVVNSPSVGQNLTDQPLLPVYFYVNSNNTFDNVLRNVSLLIQDLEEWETSQQGLFVDSSANTQGFLRLPSNSPIFKNFSDPSSGPLSAHEEIILVDGFAPFGSTPQPATGSFLTSLTVVVSPVSRGTITLASSDPFTAPIINPNYLTSEFDVFTMVQAMLDSYEFISHSLWKDFIIGPFGAAVGISTFDEAVAYARNFTITINHGIGTARMSPASAAWGVVDTKLVVKGAVGLRVVDASIFPATPECHTQAPTYIVAEKGAALIQETYGLTTGSSGGGKHPTPPPHH